MTSFTIKEAVKTLTTSPERLFTQANVQRLLYRLTGFDPVKVFPRRFLAKPKEPVYFLMTQDEVNKYEGDTKRRGQKLLTMPPFFALGRSSAVEVLSKDVEIAGHDQHSFIFVDISQNVPERLRLAVVLEPDGTLRTSTWDEHNKMIRTFFPRPWRRIPTPKMFHPESLQRCLTEKKHVFALDYACVQFEPDDPDFLRVREQVYEDVEKHGLYDQLWSTRHYGGLVFYLTLFPRLDGLLVYLLKSQRLDDVADCVQLHNIIHPNSDCAQQCNALSDPTPADLLKIYIRSVSRRKAELELLIQSTMGRRVQSAATLQI